MADRSQQNLVGVRADGWSRVRVGPAEVFIEAALVRVDRAGARAVLDLGARSLLFCCAPPSHSVGLG